MLNESTLKELYKNAIDAFPQTTRRQHATDTIKVVKLDWTPFLGVRTLFLKGLIQNEGKEYNAMMLVKDVKYTEGPGSKIIRILASNGKEYYLNKISFGNNDVLVRCECADFHWRFKHYNSLDKSLFGRNRKKYEAIYRPNSANPSETAGMCKHLMKLMKILKESSLLVD